MAGPVKGNIGQEEVVLNDAATETTLLRLLAVMEKGGGGSGGGGGGAKSAQENLIDMAQQTGKTTKQLEEFEEQVEETGNMLTRGFGHIGASMKGMALEFMSGSSRMSDFTSHIAGALQNIPLVGGLAGGALQLLTSVVDQSVDTFRDFSKVGVDLGSDLMSARQAAASAGFTLDTFQEAISNSASTLALLGGNANAGAMRFTEISKQLRGSRQEFSRLGLTMDEVAGFTADYLEQQTRLGRGQRMTDTQLAQGTKDYIFQLDYLSRVTGQQREEVAASLAALREDNRLKALYANMTKEQTEGLDQLMLQFQDAPDYMKDALTELFVGGGTAIGEASRQMVAELGPEVADAIGGLRKGTTSMEEVNKIINATGDKARETQKAQGDTISIIQAQNGEYGKFINSAAGTFQNMGSAAKEAQEAQDKARKDEAKNIAEFESLMTDFRNKIYSALIDSGIFKSVQDAMSAFTGFLSTGGTEKITAAIQPFTDWFSGLINDLTSSDDPMAVIKEYLKEGLSKLGEMIKPMIASAFSGLGSMIMSSIFGGGSSDTKTPEGKDGAAPAQEPSGGGGFLGGIIKAIAAGGAIYVGLKGFQKLLAGFAAPQVAIGAAVITGLLLGTGGAIALAGQGISSAGDGVNKIASGLERMGAIQGAENIKDLGSALGDMGTAMLSLGAGNILDSITSFFGASSPFDKMVEGINTFQNVDPAALASMTSSSGALQGLKSFADDIDSSKVEDFAESIEDLAEAMTELNDAYSKSSGFFGKNAPGSQEILQAISSGAQQGGQGLNSSIGELVALMKENNRISKQILDATGEGV